MVIKFVLNLANYDSLLWGGKDSELKKEMEFSISLNAFFTALFQSELE